FFRAYGRREGEVGWVEILVKRGGSSELSKYRYDVVMQRKPAEDGEEVEMSYEWGMKVCTEEGVKALLDQRPEGAVMTGVVDERVEEEIRAAEYMRSMTEEATIEALRKATRLSNGGREEGWEKIGQVTGYDVRIEHSSGQPAGRYDVMFERADLRN